MGRIKQAMVKNAAKQLYEDVAEFSEDFENNKKLLEGTIYYKSVRNKVAGGIVRLVRNDKKKHMKKKKVENKEDDRETTKD